MAWTAVSCRSCHSCPTTYGSLYRLYQTPESVLYFVAIRVQKSTVSAQYWSMSACVTPAWLVLRFVVKSWHSGMHTMPLARNASMYSDMATAAASGPVLPL